jgi:hypothetical protein
MSSENYTIIDTAPASHTYTGGWLCNLLDPTSTQAPDYLCGELTWDGATHSLNWYHWNGSDWTRTIISDGSGIAVGMGTADLTGNGKLDVVAADWPLGVGLDSADGHVYWFEQPDDPFADEWGRHVLATGWGKAHDLHIGDIVGLGRTDVLVRLKDGRISWYAMPTDPRDPWSENLVAESHPGDGTALYDITGTGSLDIATGAGFFENLDGSGKNWLFRPFQAAQDLELDPETRVIVGDYMGDGSVTVVIAESEVLTHARLVALCSADGGSTWETHMLIDRERDLGALHSLQLLDADGDGWPDIFTAEMELYREDTGIMRRPTWKLFLNKGDLTFAEHTVLDVNLGAHMGYAGKITGTGCTDFIAKNWQANSGNACGGDNHIVHVKGEIGG